MPSSTDSRTAPARGALDGPRVDPEGYVPSDDEEFMNPRQLAFFRKLLTDWKKGIVAESETTLASLQDGPMREPDLTDRA